MHGVALLIAAASLGVDYSWRTTDEGRLEYVIQIESEFLKALEGGEQIQSDVPPEAGQVERICVRIGTKAATHTASGKAQFKRLLVSGGRYATTGAAVPAADAIPTIFWPAKNLPEQTYAVTYGWQPNQAGQMAYYVQIDPTLLSTLRDGDEIHAALDPAAGSVGQFVILAGNKQLPRVGVQPAVLDRATPPLTSAGGKAGRFPAGNQPPFRPPTTPTGTDDGVYPRQPSRFGVDDTASVSGNLRTPSFGTAPAGGYQPAGPLLDAPAGTYGAGSTAAPGNYYGNNEPMPPAGTNYGTTYGDNRPDDRFADSRFGDPRASDPRALQPPVEPYGQGGYVQRTGAEQPQLPARNGGFTSSTNYTPQPALPDNRLAGVTRDNVTAGGPLPAPQVVPSPGTKTGTSTEEKPWMPLMFTAFALFLSIGGNLYLGWTAAEFYSRYRLATDRLRSAGR